MRFRSLGIMRTLAFAWLGLLTLEIVWRRWVERQVPSQLSNWLVYAVVGINVALVFFESAKVIRSKGPGGAGGVDQNGKKLNH